MSLTIQIHRSLTEIEKFSGEWHALEQKAGLPGRADLDSLVRWWGRYGHLRSRRLGLEQEPCVVAIRRNGKLAACLPLQRVRRRKRFLSYTELVFLSQPMNGSLLDIVHDGLEPPEVEEAFSLLRRAVDYDVLELAYLPGNSILRRTFTATIHLHSAFPFIAAGNGYEEVRKYSYSQNLKQVLNKFQRRVRESGGGIEGRMLLDREAICAIRDQIARVSLSKLKSPNMHSLYCDPQIGEKYFESIVERPQPYCSVYATSAGDLLAYNLGFRHGDAVYFLDTAYDREFADAQKIGLGILALDQMVRHFAGSCRVIDLGFGLDDYKFRFTKRAVVTSRLLRPGGGWRSLLVYRLLRQRARNGEARLMAALDKYGIPLPPREE